MCFLNPNTTSAEDVADLFEGDKGSVNAVFSLTAVYARPTNFYKTAISVFLVFIRCVEPVPENAAITHSIPGKNPTAAPCPRGAQQNNSLRTCLSSQPFGPALNRGRDKAPSRVLYTRPPEGPFKLTF